MADEEQRHGPLVDETAEKAEDLGLGGHVERGRGFVRHQDARSGASAIAMAIRWHWPPEISWGKGARDPLRLRQADLFHEGAYARVHDVAGRRPAGASLRTGHDLADLRAARISGSSAVNGS